MKKPTKQEQHCNGYLPEHLTAWAAAYLACGEDQGRARETMLERGQPWYGLLGSPGCKRGSWASKTSRITTACRLRGLLPPGRKQLVSKLGRKTIESIQQAQALAIATEAIKPAKILTAVEILERLSLFATGEHPLMRNLDPAPTAKLAYDATSTLANMLPKEAVAKALIPGEDGPSRAQRYTAVRQVIARLPQETKAELIDAMAGLREEQEQ